MAKKRKLHQLKGIIEGAWPGQVSSKSPYRGQKLYCLDVLTTSLFHSSSKETIYVFPNLVPPKIWTVLEQESWRGKKYLFYCEKRVRGWRLKEWEEIEDD